MRKGAGQVGKGLEERHNVKGDLGQDCQNVGETLMAVRQKGEEKKLEGCVQDMQEGRWETYGKVGGWFLEAER